MGSGTATDSARRAIVPNWTKENNARRCALINRKYDGPPLNETEETELERLQQEASAHRRRVAPLSIDELEALEKDFLQKHAIANKDI